MNRRPYSRVLTPSLVVALVCVAALSGCASNRVSDAGDAASFVELAKEQFRGFSGVDNVASSQNPRQSGVSPDALDGLDAALWHVEITVTMTESATAADTIAVAEAELAFSKDHAVDNEWHAGIAAGRETTVPEDDISPRRAVSLQIYPEQAVTIEDLVDGGLQIARSGNVDTVSVLRGRASVTSINAESLALAYSEVFMDPLFASGGDYRTTDGRVQLTVLPDQVSPAVIRAVIDQARRYPHAEFALVAALSGPSAPAVFVNMVSAAEATAILVALGDSTLADDLISPFTIPITIRSDAGDTGGFVAGVAP